MATKLSDNELGSMGSQYLSNPFHPGNYISYSYSMPHYRSNENNSSIFSRFVFSPPPVGNLFHSLIFPLYFFLSCVHHPEFIINFRRWPSYTSVMAWYLVFMYNRLLHFHPDVHNLYCLVSLSSLRGYKPEMKPVSPLVLWVSPWLFVRPPSQA